MKTIPFRWVALAAWAVVLLAAAVVVQRPGKGGKLYPTFVAAGEHFWLGQPIYGEVPPGQDQYRYSPLVAAMLAPWAAVPTHVGAVLWRWLQALAFLLALWAWARTRAASVESSPHAERDGYFGPALALLCLPLVAGNVFNAQLNPLVAALMLAGIAAFSRERYNLAAAAIAGAALVKVYPLALGLLLCVVEPRRFAPRLLLAVSVGGLSPFALQSEEYVTQQFADWADRVEDDDRTEQPIYKGYHDFQKVLRRWGLPTPLATYREMEVAAGCMAAAFVLWGRRSGWSRARQIEVCTGLGLVWCTLFGPATEAATYMLLAPVMALAAVEVTGRPLWERVSVRGAYLLFVSTPVASWFPRPISDPWRALVPQAHAALILLLWLLWRASRPARENRAMERESPRMSGVVTAALSPPPDARAGWQSGGDGFPGMVTR